MYQSGASTSPLHEYCAIFKSSVMADMGQTVERTDGQGQFIDDFFLGGGAGHIVCINQYVNRTSVSYRH